MPKDNFKTRLREQFRTDPEIRTDLGKKLSRKKGQGSYQTVVRHLNNKIKVHIETGFHTRKKSTHFTKLKRINVLRTLEKFITDGYESFFEEFKGKGCRIGYGYSYFILHKEQLCDLKAIFRVAFNHDHGEGPPKLAKALQELGFTYVHFISSKELPKKEKGGREKDGLRYGRGGGEGKNHKSLREWVMKNPHWIMRPIDVISKTDVPLPSGDRIDVEYRTPDGGQILAIEVKSRDSDKDDLRRGIYQCVKYRAVLRAQNCVKKVRDCSVRSLLVTERKLPEDLRKIAKSFNIELWVARHNDGKIKRLIQYLR